MWDTTIFPQNQTCPWLWLQSLVWSLRRPRKFLGLPPFGSSMGAWANYGNTTFWKPKVSTVTGVWSCKLNMHLSSSKGGGYPTLTYDPELWDTRLRVNAVIDTEVFRMWKVEDESPWPGWNDFDTKPNQLTEFGSLAHSASTLHMI